MNYLPRLLLLLLLQVFALSSFACGSGPGATPPTISELFQEAKTVFTAHVYRTEEKSEPATSTDKTQFVILEGEFRVIETLKGTPPADRKIRAFLLPCGGVLVSGLDYIFFIREGQEIESWAHGSRVLPTLVGSTATNTFLEPIRKLAKDQP